MLSYWLLIISIGGVFLIYLLLLISKLRLRKIKVEEYTGFDIAKEVTANYEEINIVRSNDIVISEYDIKRNVIRLNDKNYNGTSYYDMVVSSILAGISLVKSENSNYFKFSFLFKKLRGISIVPIVMGVLSYFVTNIGDAKLVLVLFGVVLVYLYMRYQIIVSATGYIKDNLKDEIYENIKLGIESYINFYKLSFIVSLVMIVRLVVIIMGI